MVNIRFCCQSLRTNKQGLLYKATIFAPMFNDHTGENHQRRRKTTEEAAQKPERREASRQAGALTVSTTAEFSVSERSEEIKNSQLK